MGCIGGFIPKLPLYKAVIKKSLESMWEDFRFDNSKKGSEDAKYLSISVLSPLNQIKPENIIAGYHGVRVTAQGAGGTYLPEVAPEQNWTKEEMLLSLCKNKAMFGSKCPPQTKYEISPFSSP